MQETAAECIDFEVTASLVMIDVSAEIHAEKAKAKAVRGRARPRRAKPQSNSKREICLC